MKTIRKVREKENQMIIDRIRTKVFTNNSLSQPELDFITALWAKMISEYKDAIDSWDIILWDLIYVIGFNPKNFFIVHSRIKKGRKFFWLGEEVSINHRKQLLGEVHSGVTTISLYRRRRIHIYMNLESNSVFYETLVDGVRNGPIYVKTYSIDDLAFVRRIFKRCIKNYGL
jgi:hypothetical protein